MKRILVAIDGSETGDRAVDFAARMAQHEHCAMTILNVVDHCEPPSQAVGEFALQEHSTPADTLNAWAAQTVRMATDRARQLGIDDVESELGSGEAATSILETADREGADVIVVGKRGLGRIRGTLFGSISQKVMSNAHCVVIVVP